MLVLFMERCVGNRRVEHELMKDRVPGLLYNLHWGERSIISVANLTCRKGDGFLELVPRIRIRTELEAFQLKQANVAQAALRGCRITGAAVLDI